MSIIYPLLLSGPQMVPQYLSLITHQCYGLNVLPLLPLSYAAALTPDLMVFGSGAFRN